MKKQFKITSPKFTLGDNLYTINTANGDVVKFKVKSIKTYWDSVYKKFVWIYGTEEDDWTTHHSENKCSKDLKGLKLLLEKQFKYFYEIIENKEKKL